MRFFEKNEQISQYLPRKLSLPNHTVLGAQLAPGEKRIDCIPVNIVLLHSSNFLFCLPAAFQL